MAKASDLLKWLKLQSASNEGLPLEMLAKLEEAGKIDARKIEKRTFHYFVMLLDDSDPVDVPSLITQVWNVFSRHGATLSSITSSLIAGYLGVPLPDKASVETRRKLVKDIVEAGGGRLRIAHGQCEGLVGNLGIKNRWIYQAIVPNFSGILERLVNSPLGATIEM